MLSMQNSLELILASLLKTSKLADLSIKPRLEKIIILDHTTKNSTRDRFENLILFTADRIMWLCCQVLVVLE